MATETLIRKSTGLYTAREAARLLSWAEERPLAEAQLRGWIDAETGLLEWDGAPEWDDDGECEQFIDFQTLISLRLIYRLHLKGLAVETIAAVPWLRRELGLWHPFASKGLWLRSLDYVGFLSSLPAAPMSLRGKGGYTGAGIRIGPVIEAPGGFAHSSGLQFDADGLACAWAPMDGILIHSGVATGSPCLAGTRIPTRIFPAMLDGGDSLESLAQAYGLTAEKVRLALDWEEQLDAAA